MNARKKFTQEVLTALVVASSKAFYSSQSKFEIYTQGVFFNTLNDALKHSKLRKKTKNDVSVAFVDENWPVYSKEINRIINHVKEIASEVFDEQMQGLAQQLLG